MLASADEMSNVVAIVVDRTMAESAVAMVFLESVFMMLTLFADLGEIVKCASVPVSRGQAQKGSRQSEIFNQRNLL
jgi:hypothetical protein